MENHVNAIANLCRICGKKVVPGRGYTNQKSVNEYEDCFMQLFHIKISEENPEVQQVFYYFTRLRNVVAS